ncbi:MAG: PKD domain-containing protein [Chloroflexi bacterium]|nr:PKD domain-containing protein [Chloroflexota bacterium]
MTNTRLLSCFLAIVIVFTLVMVPPGRSAQAQDTAWALQRSWQPPALYGMDLADAQNGWAVGSGGAILHTANGGADWTPQTSTTVYDLWAVDFVDASKGWAVGLGIWHTENGGATWAAQGSSTVVLQDVFFLDASTGWAVGGDGTILHTSDGGASWESQTSMVTVTLYAVDFISHSEGWAVGYGGTVLQTWDGGTHWNVRPTTFTDALNGVDFVNSQQGWAVGADQKIWHTSNGGSSWSQQYGGLSSRYLFDIAMVDATSGWAAGHNGLILHTANGGALWEEQSNPAAPGNLNSIIFRDAYHGWAAGDYMGTQGAIIRYAGAPPPVADFQVSTTSGGAPLTVQFTDTSTGTIDSWLWDFGDGETSTGQNPSHIYTNAGTYTVSLTVSGSGSFDTETKADLISVTAVPSGAIRGRVYLQGRSNHQGTQIELGGHQAITDAQGNFTLAGIPEGTYDVLAVSRDGYIAAHKVGIEVVAGDTMWLGQALLRGGDVTGDSAVNIQDLVQIGANFNSQASQADVDGNGFVNVLDLSLAGLNFGQQGPKPWPPKGLLQWRKLAGALRGGTTYDASGTMTPEIVPLADGTYRMYYAGSDGTNWRILSATSSNGLAWTRESGIRVDTFGSYSAIYRPSVVTLPDGSYRMYFSAASSEPLYADIYSATSADGLAWTVEPGMRIEHGGTYDTVLAHNPSVVKDADGGYYRFPDGNFRLYYSGWDGSHFRILSASSTDGLAWTEEGIRLNFGHVFSANQVSDPYVVRMGDGSFAMLFSGSNGTPGPGVPLASAAVKQGVTGMATSFQFMQTGSFSMMLAHSLDGAEWFQEMWPGFGLGHQGTADSAGVFGPAIAQIEAKVLVFFTGSDGALSSILGAMQAEADPISRVRVTRVSAAQLQVTFDYDPTVLPEDERPGLRMETTVLTDGDELPGFYCPTLLLPTEKQTLTFYIDYDGVGYESSNQLSFDIYNPGLSGQVPLQNMGFTGGPIVTAHAASGPKTTSIFGPYSVYQETIRHRNDWEQAWSATISIARPTAASGDPDSFLPVRVDYNYTNILGKTATLEVEALRYGDVVPDLEATSAAIAPGQDDVTLNLSYTGLVADRFSSQIKARLKLGTTEMATANKDFSMDWEPPYDGDITGVQVPSFPNPDRARVEVTYNYQSARTGLLGYIPGKLTVSALLNGTVRSEVEQVDTVPLKQGTNTVEVELCYTGGQTSFATDQLRFELTAENQTFSTTTAGVSITWNPSLSGSMTVTPTIPSKMARNASELELLVDYTYLSKGSTTAELRAEIYKEGEISGLFLSSPVTITPTHPAADGTLPEPRQATLTLTYRGTPLNYTTDKVRVSIVGPNLVTVAEGWARFPKTWNPPTTATIDSVSLSRSPGQSYSELLVSYSYHYDSPAGERARIAVGPVVGGGQTWVYVAGFDADDLEVQPGSGWGGITIFYGGDAVNAHTQGIKVTIWAGPLGGRPVASYLKEEDTRWDPPPSGTIDLGEVERVDDRNIRLPFDYTLIASPGQTTEVRFEVVQDILPLPNFQGTTVSVTPTTAGVHRTATITYTGDLPYVESRLLRAKLLVQGETVARSSLDYEREWYTTPPGTFDNFELEQLSPNEALVVVDYFSPAATEDSTSYVKLYHQDGEAQGFSYTVKRVAGGAMLGRLAFLVKYVGIPLRIYEVEVGLQRQGITLLKQRFEWTSDWSLSTTDSVSNAQVTRPSDSTAGYKVNVTFNYSYHSGTAAALLEPLVWKNGLPQRPNEEKPELFPWDYLRGGATLSPGDSSRAIQIPYTSKVGNFDIDAISLIMKDQETGDPIYSYTFPVDEHIQPPDAILGAYFDTQGMKTRGEIAVVVQYALNSTASAWVWPSAEGQGSAFRDFEPLTSGAVAAQQGQGLTLWHLRLKDTAYESRIGHDQNNNPAFIDSLPVATDLEFNLGTPGLTPLAKRTLQWSQPEWDQPVTIQSTSSFVYWDTPYPDRLALWGVDHFTGSGIGWPSATYGSLFLGAIPMWQGQPLGGFEMRPYRIRDFGAGYIPADRPITLSYNFSGEETSITGDAILFYIFKEQVEEDGNIPTILFSWEYPFQHTWVKPPDSLEVGSIEPLEETPEGLVTKLRVNAGVDYVSFDRVASQGGVAQVRAQVLRNNIAFPGFVSTAIRLPDAGIWGTFLEISYTGTRSPETDQIEIILEVVDPNTGVVKEGLNHLVVDYAAQWGTNTYIVAVLQSVYVSDDMDWPSPGEWFFNANAVSGEAKFNSVWPSQMEDARWYEASDGHTIEMNFPIFYQRQDLMGQRLGIALVAQDDDSYPKWISVFLDVVVKLGELVCNIFGQAEIATALEIVNSVAQKAMEYSGATDLVDAYVNTELNRSNGWGSEEYGGIVQSGGQFKEGGRMGYPLIVVKKLTVPNPGKPLTVRLNDILTHESGDYYNGEVFIHTRVFDGFTTEEGDFPSRSLDDGEHYPLADYDPVIFHTDAAGPFLYIEVDVWDEDEPDIADDHDMLGIATWLQEAPSYGLSGSSVVLSKRVTGIDEGDVTVTVVITSP